MLAVEERNRSEREGFKFYKEPGGSGYDEKAKTSFASISRGEKTAIDEKGDI